MNTTLSEDSGPTNKTNFLSFLHLFFSPKLQIVNISIQFGRLFHPAAHYPHITPHELNKQATKCCQGLKWWPWQFCQKYV